MELLLGCGHARDRKIRFSKDRNVPPKEGWDQLVTLDINPECKPDVVFDLNSVRGKIYGPLAPKSAWLPWVDNTFDEIHAYEVLEHCGQQGDYKLLFAQFSEFHRILKPGGLFCATVPHWNSLWAWGDPSHTRIINSGTLAFLSQKEYAKQLGNTSMTDYRNIYKADFDCLYQEVVNDGNNFVFVLEAIK